MCMMLYLAAREELPLRSSPDLSIEAVDPRREAVRQWFSLPVVRFVGAHTGCSCGFPNVTAEEPIEYFDGMFADTEARPADLKSAAALIGLIREIVDGAGEVEFYAVWDGEESSPPKGTIDTPVGALSADRFFLNERFLYRVSTEP